MRFSVQLPTDRVDPPDAFCSGAAVAEMARAAEAAGFDAVFVTDHPIPDDAWLASGGHHTLDPFVALSFAAAATGRLRLQTHVVVAPYRNPFLTAKAVASLDVLSGGRALLGVSAGYLEAEFAALGVPFEERNALTDEALDVMVRVWTGESLSLGGRHFRADGHTSLPRPLQLPHPPIWVGGNSRVAIRRAVERGDGWLPFPAPAGLARRVRTAPLDSPEALAERIDYARAHAAKVGRTRPLDVIFVPFGLEMFARDGFEPGRVIEGVRSLADLGVTWCTVNVPRRSRADYLENLARFGEQILAPLRGDHR